MDALKQLFQQTFSSLPSDVVRLPIAGSNRQYFRLTSDNGSAVGVIGTSTEENRAFCSIATHFREKGIDVPEVYAHSDDYTCYLQEDLGCDVLFDRIVNASNSSTESDTLCLLEKTMAALPKIQFEGADGLDFSVCYPQSSFDKRTVMWDLNYFKYNFLKTQQVDFREDLLEDDFEKLAQLLLHDAESDTFLYRDFQSRNVMIKNDRPYFIDFQGGRCGPIYYDVASFLWQAKAGFSDEMRAHLIDVYLQNLRVYRTVGKEEFLQRLHLFVFFRTLQVLGAYGFRGLFERKKHFVQSIPLALDNLNDILSKIDTRQIPYLVQVLKQLLGQQKACQHAAEPDVLTIKVYSFSYPKGIPDDTSGNGGGYVFDCRGIHNPGRYEPYKKLTGMDEPVIRFLEDDGEIAMFLQSVYDLADRHVERYLERGFKHLMFAFGCTGGQHRSVYSAQHLAEHLARKYPVRVELCHREQNRTFVFEHGKLLND